MNIYVHRHFHTYLCLCGEQVPTSGNAGLAGMIIFKSEKILSTFPP